MGESLEEFQEPLTVPQLSPKSGVSEDYINEFATVPTYLELFEENKIPAQKLLEIFGRKTKTSGSFLKKYNERFPPDQYKDLITTKNSRTVEIIDSTAEECNQKFTIIERSTGTAAEKVDQIKRQILPLLKQLENLIRNGYQN
jgi:hypothetical protein